MSCACNGWQCSSSRHACWHLKRLYISHKSCEWFHFSCFPSVLYSPAPPTSVPSRPSWKRHPDQKYRINRIYSNRSSNRHLIDNKRIGPEKIDLLVFQRLDPRSQLPSLSQSLSFYLVRSIVLNCRRTLFLISARKNQCGSIITARFF